MVKISYLLDLGKSQKAHFYNLQNTLAMKKFKLPFKKGDIVTDIKHNEVFVFDRRSDGYVVNENPHWFRLANEHEKNQLKKSGKQAIKL